MNKLNRLGCDIMVAHFKGIMEEGRVNLAESSLKLRAYDLGVKNKGLDGYYNIHLKTEEEVVRVEGEVMSAVLGVDKDKAYYPNNPSTLDIEKIETRIWKETVVEKARVKADEVLGKFDGVIDDAVKTVKSMALDNTIFDKFKNGVKGFKVKHNKFYEEDSGDKEEIAKEPKIGRRYWVGVTQDSDLVLCDVHEIYIANTYAKVFVGVHDESLILFAGTEHRYSNFL